MRSLILVLAALFAVSAQAQPVEGSSGWICNNYNGDADFDGDPITIDTGSDRALAFAFGRNFSSWDITTLTIGGVAPTGTAKFFGSTVSSYIHTYVWSEADIGSMSGNAVDFETTVPSGNFAVCYATLTTIPDQSGLATHAHLDEQESTTGTSDDVGTPSTATDYVCAVGLAHDSTTTFTGWDTLTEKGDLSTNNNGRLGIGCDTGGDDPTTVTISASLDLQTASFAFSSEAAGPDQTLLNLLLEEY